MLLSGMSTIVVTPPAAAARERGRESLPLGAPRLVDVHVRVDQAGKDPGVAHVEASADGSESAMHRDLAGTHHERGGTNAVGRDDAAGSKREIGHGGRRT